MFNLVIVAWISLLVAPAGKQIVKVTSLPALQQAVNEARPGEEIVLADGVYNATEAIAISCRGTKEQPVTVRAETTGGTQITGAAGFRLVAPATYVIIRGFKFTHHAAQARSDNGTTFCRWTQNVFETPGKGDYLTLSGSDHEIDANIFQNKSSLGKFIAVRGHESQIAERLWIHHNYFNNFSNQDGQNGAEALQFGLSGFSLSSSNSIVEFNLFENCDGENELISVKASAVILRYNTIRNCPAQFTLRHGNRCQVYGNYFVNTPGLRIFGDDHVVHSNYFENCSMAINIGNGGGEVADGAKLTSHDRPDRVLIAFNTLVDNRRNIVQTPRKEGLGATYITLAYNIISGGGPSAEISGPLTNSVWRNNIIFETESAGDMPAAGYRSLDPGLSRNKTGTFHLADISPAKNIAKDAFDGVATDMDGQPRSDKALDAGADEISEANAPARMLSPKDVGPSGMD